MGKPTKVRVRWHLLLEGGREDGDIWGIQDPRLQLKETVEKMLRENRKFAKDEVDSVMSEDNKNIQGDSGKCQS